MPHFFLFIVFSGSSLNSRTISLRHSIGTLYLYTLKYVLVYKTGVFMWLSSETPGSSASYRKTSKGNGSQGRLCVCRSCVKLITVGTWIPSRQVKVNKWRMLINQQPPHSQSTEFAYTGGLEENLLCTWCWESLGSYSEELDVWVRACVPQLWWVCRQLCLLNTDGTSAFICDFMVENAA